MPCQIPYRGDTSQMLLFKIASCIAEGAGGVLSFNGRDGVVTLTSGDVTGALGFTPISEADGDARYVLKAGDTMTGALAIHVTDASTTGAPTVLNLTHNLSAGVPLAGLGVSLEQSAETTTTESQRMTRWLTAWLDPVHATRTAQTTFFSVLNGVDSIQLILGNNVVQLGAAGTAAAPSLIFRNDVDTGIYFPVADSIGFSAGGTLRLTVSSAAVTSTVPFLLPDGTAALPALAFQSDTNTGIYRIGADILGFSTAGTARWQITAAGHFEAFSNNAYDIGGAGGNQPRNIFAASNIVAGTTSFIGFSGRAGMLSPSSENLRLSNSAQTDFGRLQFGGTASAFPSIKRSGATLQFRLADDSAFAAIATAGIVMSVGAPLTMTAGANQRAGNAVLVAGTVTVANTTVTANTVILLTRKTAGGTLGTSVTYTVIAATSFTITSDSAIDTSTFSYLLIET